MPAAAEASPARVIEADTFDVLVVGAGFAGMYLLHRLRGLGFRVRVLEAGSGVGGTWYWNRYPGARCDVESLQYSYQFSDELQQDWDWTERYAAQAEILHYANHVADRFDLRRDIDFDTRVKSASWDEATRTWNLSTNKGRKLTARFCVMATGCLSSPSTPRFKGLETFRGKSYHTGYWPHERVDFSGQRVAVVGTGSSAVQSIPIIATEASRLYVFQRTPNYVVPAHNRPLSREEQRQIKAGYAALRARARQTPTGIELDYNPLRALDVSEAEREAEYERRWQRGGLTFNAAFADQMMEIKSNNYAADFVRRKIRAIVKDQAVAELLSPKDVIGCKRLCVDIGYYETFNRKNVTLVDISNGGIDEITPLGVKAGGKEYEVDAIVLATGFDAMTGALLKIDVRGSGGLSLADKWRDGPRSYLGLAIAGFPNLFTVTGPGSPSVLTNMLPTIEQHVDWITDAIVYMRERRLETIEASPRAESDWVAHVGGLADHTLRHHCNSWYLGANIPGKPRVFMPYIGGFPRYCEETARIARQGYEGFALT